MQASFPPNIPPTTRRKASFSSRMDGGSMANWRRDDDVVGGERGSTRIPGAKIPSARRGPVAGHVTARGQGRYRPPYRFPRDREGRRGAKRQAASVPVPFRHDASGHLQSNATSPFSPSSSDLQLRFWETFLVGEISGAGFFLPRSKTMPMPAGSTSLTIQSNTHTCARLRFTGVGIFWTKSWGKKRVDHDLGTSAQATAAHSHEIFLPIGVSMQERTRTVPACSTIF
ncbi:hypothetical protein SEVIR_6G222150v4 [Setaria viridis]